MTGLTVNIDVASAKWKNAFPRLKPKIEKAAAAALKGAGLKKGKYEINLLLATDARIKTLNRDWRGMDKPTNVLSFPQFALLPPRSPRSGRERIGTRGRGSVALGDVILAIETIKRECRLERKALENHTIHLVVHGVLHLLGYDHMHEKDAKSMEKLECDILGSLGYPDPYHDHAAENG
jgi:probable rRNA maturation factor